MKVWVMSWYNNFDGMDSDGIDLFETKEKALAEMNRQFNSIMTEYGYTFIDNNWLDWLDAKIHILKRPDYIEAYDGDGTLCRCCVYAKEVRK